MPGAEPARRPCNISKKGLLGPQLILGHGVWLSEDDIARVVETGVMICHNASSNLRLRSGVAPVNHFLAHGVRVSLGLDEAGINDDRDMVQEMRLVLRLHRTPGMDERVPTCPEVFRMATEHGAQTTGFADAIGTLEPGKAADLVVMNRQSFAYPYLDDSVPVLDAIVHRGKASGVETVLVAGEPVLPQGQFTRINKAEVLEELATALHGERAWLRWVSTSLVCDIRGNRYVFDEPSVSMVARFVGTYRRRLLKDGVMDYRRLGNSGLQVSVIGLGTNNFGVRNDYPEAERILMQAIEEGINFIETSNTYGEGAAEEFIGKALKGHRDQVLLATKVASNMGDGPNQHGASRKHILTQVEASLKRLQTDYLDLYQIHYYDPFTPLDESLRTLHNLVMQGKVRYIGCSNFAAWQVAEAMGVVRALDLEPLVSVEPEYSMLKRGIEKELLPCCQRFNIGILPYFPLASGFLTGKYKRGQAAPAGTRLAVQTQRAEFILTDENFDVLEQLEAFASARSRTMVELAFAWLLTHSQVSSVIAGATRPEQIIANAKASEWRLTSEEMNELNDVLQTLAPAWDTPTAHLRPYRPW